MALTTSAHQILQNAAPGTPMDAMPAEFWEIVERYRGDLVNQAFALLGSQEDAEDIAQETFCEAFRDRDRLAKVRSLGAWLRQINRANALNRRRDRKRHSDRAQRKQLEAPGRAFTTGGFSTLVVREAVAKAIELLPEAQRETVVLHYWQHLGYDEIARRLKISPRTVRRNLHDAYQALYERLGRFLEPGQEGPRS